MELSRRVAVRRWAVAAGLVVVAIIAVGCVPAAPAPRFRPGTPPVRLVTTPTSLTLVSDFTHNDFDSQTVTVENFGTSLSSPLWIPATPPHAWGNFWITNDHCSNQRLPNGGKCTFDANFSAEVSFGFVDSQSYTVTDGSSSIGVVVTGQGTPSVLWSDNASADIRTTPTITRSAAAAGPTSYFVSVHNLSGTPVGPLTFAVHPLGGNTGTFTLADDNCTSASVAPGNECTVEIKYDNTTGSGLDGAVLTVDWADGSSALGILGQGTP